MLDSIGMPMVFFVTSNPHKFHEVNTIFTQNTSIQLKLIQTSVIEIQSLDLEEIAFFSLEKCSQDFHEKPIFVEDSGLFIKQLNGFPGPFSAYIFKTIGLKGVLTLMQQVNSREAYFQSSIALKIDDGIEIFTERVKGKISRNISESGWGYDPIFIPDCDGIHTFGDLGHKKNSISHRFLATLKLIKFLEDHLFEMN